MREFFNEFLLNKVGKLVLVLMFAFSAFVFASCEDDYKTMALSVSYNGNQIAGNHVVVSIVDGQTSFEQVSVEITGNDKISRLVNISTESDLINIKSEFDNNTQKTILTISANGLCNNVPVVVSSAEGGKTATFYVSVIAPVVSIASNGENSEMYVIKGHERTLITKDLIVFNPSGTTQKEVVYSLKDSTLENVSIIDNKLLVANAFTGSKVEVVATSVSDPTKTAELVFHVLPELDSKYVSVSAVYANGDIIDDEVVEKSIISMAKNISSKNSITFSVRVNLNGISVDNSVDPTNIEEQISSAVENSIASSLMVKGIVNSSLTTESEIINFDHYEKTIKYKEEATSLSVSDKFVEWVHFDFTINAGETNGKDGFFFEISFANYDISIKTPVYKVEVYDAVTDILFAFDDEGVVETNDYQLTVYDTYAGVLGKEIVSSVIPTSVNSADKILRLKLGTNASNYYFFTAGGKSIQFQTSDENEMYYDFNSGEKFYIRAKVGETNKASFTIAPKTDSSLVKRFIITPDVGATSIEITNGQLIEGNKNFYLTNNAELETTVEFTATNSNLNQIKVVTTGNNFTIGEVVETRQDTYFFTIKSIANIEDAVGDFTIKLDNGFYVKGVVQTFYQLVEKDVSFTVPLAQYNSAIGQMTRNIEHSPEIVDKNLEFFVSIQKGAMIDLTIKARGATSISYAYLDNMFGPDQSVYEDTNAYLSFNTFSLSMLGTDVYTVSTKVIKSLYLTSYNQIYALDVGKTWVKANVSGKILENGVKVSKSYYYYFLVETYNPIKVFNVETSNISLLSFESVGDSDYEETFKELKINLTEDATYNRITWYNNCIAIPDGITENKATYTLNNTDVFAFTNNTTHRILEDGTIQQKTIKVEAFSTIYLDDSDGEVNYYRAKSITYDFVAKVCEFDSVYAISLRVTIVKAQQVEDILVKNVNVEDGIYLELSNGAYDITTQIFAEVRVGESEILPYNSDLVYTFIPDNSTDPRILTINSKTGHILIDKDTIVGGSGVIRIAPSDRIKGGLYVPGEKDVAVYIAIVIADGGTRDTSYRISSLADVTNPKLHYTLLVNDVINIDDGLTLYGIFETFEGGLYGAIKGKTNYVTIATNKTLFSSLLRNSCVEDLIIEARNITGSGCGVVCDSNYGSINNVSVETYSNGNTFNGSKLSVNNLYLYAGGLAGENYGEIIKCNFYGSVIARNSTVGGITGYNIGVVDGCSVEFYKYSNYNNDYGSLLGAVTGGLVGLMEQGTLLNSYVYSYVYILNESGERQYLNCGVLPGSLSDVAQRGVLVGVINAGRVNICFGFINEFNTMFGNDSAIPSTVVVDNAYILYRDVVDPTKIGGLYYQNKVQIADYTIMTPDSIWDVNEDKNFGMPFFKSILQNETIEEINNPLTSLSNVLTTEGALVVYLYQTDYVTTNAEYIKLSSLNTTLFSSLLGNNASGIRGVSSNSEVLETFANSFKVKKTGYVDLVLFSKYDFSISQTFRVYVIYPIENFHLESSNAEFGNGSTINVKVNKGFSMDGKVSDIMLLVNRDVIIKTNPTQLVFGEIFRDYITGSGLGSFAFDTFGIYNMAKNNDTNKMSISYTLKLNENQLLQGIDIDNNTEINTILNEHFNGNFVINFYRGSDEVVLSSSIAEIEPSDVYVFNSSIYTDLIYSPNDEMIPKEALRVKVYYGEELAQKCGYYNPNDATNVYTDEPTYKNDDTTSVYILTIDGEEAFEVTIDYLETIGYIDNINRVVTENTTKMTYYQHKFKISILVKDNYKNHPFNSSQFKFEFFALSSEINNRDYKSDIVKNDFILTVKSQSVLSVTTAHYASDNRIMKYDELTGKTINYYEYKTQSSSVLTPGKEGLLSIDIYPIYSSFEYLTVTYESSTGDNYDLRLGMMTQFSPSLYTKSTKGFVFINNGLKVYNNYNYENSYENGLNTMFLSTYVPETIDKDLIYYITITAYGLDSETGKPIVVGNSVKFNLVVQYLYGATIQVVDDNGKEITTVARGTVETILVTMEKEQSFDGTLTFSGWDLTNETLNYISYSSFEMVENPNPSSSVTYKASLYVGSELKLIDDNNYINIECVVNWVINGKTQEKKTVISVGVVDFLIDDVTLATDKLDKTSITAYIGVQTQLDFDFTVQNYIGELGFENHSLDLFLNDNYFADDAINPYGSYIVNYGNENKASFAHNLYYSDGISLYRPNGMQNSNDVCSFDIVDGEIKIIGKRTGSVEMQLVIPVQYPNPMLDSYDIRDITFNFTIKVSVYTDEDTPLIIDNEDAFYNALDSNVPQNYILLCDLNLLDYTPRNTSAIESLDGNNFTINILSWNTERETTTLNLGLFTTIAETTTIKNLIVNTYHATEVLVDTTLFNDVNIAGLAVENNGVIYNTAVIAYDSGAIMPKLNVKPGIKVNYTMNQIDELVTSKIAGFVVTNKGSITNSRVGGEDVVYVDKGPIELESFNISGQGDIAGFVYENSGTISSSYFANGTIDNKTTSGIITSTSGFAGTNNGTINLSYTKGIGKNEFSLSEGGISTASISAGFIYNNSGEISDCYSNIMLTTNNAETKNQYSSGRLTSGFVYNNTGTVERGYTASKIEDAKTTQMNFIGVDNYGEMKNTGKIKTSYYYNINSDLDDAYTATTDSISVKRIEEPDMQSSFYGFSFASSATMYDGVWFITSTGIDLVSANQIAISSRYISDEKRDENTDELISYALPYKDGFAYGSNKNPIIIRNAIEFNKVFGGDPTHTGSAIASYFDIENSLVYGNYRIISEIDLNDLITDNTSGVRISSSGMTLRNGVIDGNAFKILGLELVAKTSDALSNFGMFASLDKDAIIMNMKIQLVAVSAVTVQNVGAVAGTIDSSKLTNIHIFGNSVNANITGNNIVGGVVGKVVGESNLRNLSTDNVNVTSNFVTTNLSQRYARDETIYNPVNKQISFAGGIAGVIDFYKAGNKYNLNFDETLSAPQATFLQVTGNMSISASTVGGICGYLGSASYLQDITLELDDKLTQKIIAYNCFAGGIAGSSYGIIDMARAQHEEMVQTEIEANISNYYKNLNATENKRGNLTLFEHSEKGKYSPIAIGGLIGEMVTGKITHSYSKINVRNDDVTYAGGIVGKISYAVKKDINKISFLEVYSFGDVYTSIKENKITGAGGIVGYIDYTRQIAFDKVNAVNYWSLAYDETSGLYYMPSNIYDIFALTGCQNANQPDAFIDRIVVKSGDDWVYNSSVFRNYLVPEIICAIGGEDVFAHSNLKYNYNGEQPSVALKMSYATLGEDAIYQIVDQDKQVVEPFYNLSDATIAGGAMDSYFRNADWDPAFWFRFQDDVFPSLITTASSQVFYIRVAEDLENIRKYPSATFIVIGKDGDGIVPVGTYIKNTGIDDKIRNFTGVLKGFDNTGNYGFDFQGYSVSLMNSTTSGAKLYNMTIKNLGSAGGLAQEDGSGAFIKTATLTTFENLTFKNSQLLAFAKNNPASTDEYVDVGLMCNVLYGGYVSNISFEDCSVSAYVGENLDKLNVGLLAGSVRSYYNTYTQLTDITAYLTDGIVNIAGNKNRININMQNNSVEELNVGGITGMTEGSVLITYTANSAPNNFVKSFGVVKTSMFSYEPPKKIDELSVNTEGSPCGFIVDVFGSGKVANLNGALMVGKANSLNVSCQRSSTENRFFVVGSIKSTKNTVEFKNVKLGSVVGNGIVTSITNTSSGKDKFFVADCNILINSQNIVAGALIGYSSQISDISGIDSFGSINTLETILTWGGNPATTPYIGGLVGFVNSSLEIKNSSSKTKIIYIGADSSSKCASIGGFVGYYSGGNGKLVIGTKNYKTKYLGSISVSANYAYVGGVLGSIGTSTTAVGPESKIRIDSAVFGGKITVTKAQKIIVGGILGASRYNDSGSEVSKIIEDCLSFGDIYVNCTFPDSQTSSFGGILGRGSSATIVNNNYSIASIYTKGSQYENGADINAVVGTSNGSNTDNDMSNYYSSLVTLCLDANQKVGPNGLLTENIYYQTYRGDPENMVQTTINEKLSAYRNNLSQEEKAFEFLEGSKIYPYEINNDTYNSYVPELNNDVKLNYFVITKDSNDQELRANTFSKVTLKNAFLIGDGVTLTNDKVNPFTIINDTSVITGIKVLGQLTNTDITTSEYLGHTGAGILANINRGTIYACNTNEYNASAKFGEFGIQSSGNVGGLVGVNYGYIEDCYSDADVNGVNVGGFVGLNAGTIINCYSTGMLATGYAFANTTATSNIRYCYTASTKISIPSDTGNITNNGLTGVVGNDGTVKGCYYDLFATGIYQNKAGLTKSNTNTMSIGVEGGEGTGTTLKPVFLTNTLASSKFEYHYDRNYGYLSFGGTIFKNFPYMQNVSTGNGLTETSPIQIPHIGKFQQINLALSKTYNYALTNDMFISESVKLHASLTDENEANIINWLPIGNDTNKFTGNITGAYSTDKKHTLFRIVDKVNTASFYYSVFGRVSKATISNMIVDYEKSFTTNVTKTHVAGLVCIAENESNINNIDFDKISGLVYNGSSTAYIGGIVAEAITSNVENCKIIGISEIGYYGHRSTGMSCIGGIVGIIKDGAKVKKCSLGKNVIVNYGLDSINTDDTYNLSSASVGGIVGQATLASASVATEIIGCTVDKESSVQVFAEKMSDICYAGGIVGSTNNTTIQGCSIKGGSGAKTGNILYDYNIGYTSNNMAYLGGIVGYSVMNTTLQGVVVGEDTGIRYITEVSGDNTIAKMGGIIGGGNGIVLSKFVDEENGTEIKNKIEANLSMKYTGNQDISMGGVVGIIEGEGDEDTEFKEITVGTGANYTYEYSGPNRIALIKMGGLTGELSKTLVDDVTIGNATYDIFKSSADKVSTVSLDLTIGGLVGEATFCPISNVTIGNTNLKIKNDSGDVEKFQYRGSFGGLAGVIENNGTKDGEEIKNNHTITIGDTILKVDNTKTETQMILAVMRCGGLAGDWRSYNFTDVTIGKTEVYMDNQTTKTDAPFSGSYLIGGIAGSAHKVAGWDKFKYSYANLKVDMKNAVESNGGSITLGGYFGQISETKMEDQGYTVTNPGEEGGGTTGPVYLTITNFNFDFTSAKMGSKVGAFAGMIYNSKLSFFDISNCTFKGNGMTAGGLAGEIHGSEIDHVNIYGISLTGEKSNMGLFTGEINKGDTADSNLKLNVVNIGYNGILAGTINANKGSLAGGFAGKIDSCKDINDVTISGMTINFSEVENVGGFAATYGLFQTENIASAITNVKMENITLNEVKAIKSNIGGFIGQVCTKGGENKLKIGGSVSMLASENNTDDTIVIKGFTVKGDSEEGSNVGGFIGLSDGTLEDDGYALMLDLCTFGEKGAGGVIQSKSCAGGIIGRGVFSLINNCKNYATVTANRYAGGIIAINTTLINKDDSYGNSGDLYYPSAEDVNYHSRLHECENYGGVKALGFITKTVTSPSSGGETPIVTPPGGGTTSTTEYITPFAGGIIGYVSEVPGQYSYIDVSKCYNKASGEDNKVEAGTRETISPYTVKELQDLTISDNNLYPDNNDYIDGVSKISAKGSPKAYAGGIAGYAPVKCDFNDCQNSSVVESKAQIGVLVNYNVAKVETFPPLPPAYYSGKRLMATEIENAYANGISYININSAKFGTYLSNCCNTGLIKGGHSLSINMYYSMHGLGKEKSYEDFIVIDYGYASTSLNQICSSFRMFEAGFFGIGNSGGKPFWNDPNEVDKTYQAVNNKRILAICWSDSDNPVSELASLYYYNQICNNPRIVGKSLTNYYINNSTGMIPLYSGLHITSSTDVAYSRVANCIAAGAQSKLNIYPTSLVFNFRSVEESVILRQNYFYGTGAENNIHDTDYTLGRFNFDYPIPYTHQDQGLNITFKASSISGTTLDVLA